jgi:predicted DNA-binding transcriptional regulator YafY
MSMPEIIAELATYDIHAERKSIYNDMEILRQYGVDIEVQKGKVPRYYVANRQFELPELKLLVDAVQSSRFITEKKSAELITKLSALTSQAQAADLKRHIFVADRPKSFNEQSFYSVDAIHTAINEGKKITFKYFDYDVHKKPAYRKDGAAYEVTPITLCWDSDKYYLVAYNAEHDELRNYRVDRMDSVTVSDTSADAYNKSKFNIPKHIKGMFGMFSGEVVQANLSFDNSFVNVVLDYFGKDTIIKPKNDNWFEVSVDVIVSPVFLGWIFQFGGKAKIISPDNLVDAMKKLMVANVETYS